MNVLFVFGISAVIQFTKACLDSVSKKEKPALFLVYLCTVLLSASFSAQAMITAAYPASRFAQLATEELTSGYTNLVLTAQSSTAAALSDARETIFENLEKVRTSLDTGEAASTTLDSSAILEKYGNINCFSPDTDNYYRALKQVLETADTADYASAAQLAQDTQNDLKAERQELEATLEQVNNSIDSLRRKSSGLRGDAKAALQSQIENLVDRNGKLQAKSEAYSEISNDLTSILRALGSGSAAALQAVDQLEQALLQPEQDPALIRSLTETALESADTGMDLNSLSSMYTDVAQYLSLLGTNTTLKAEVAGLESLSEEQTDGNWQAAWDSRVSTFRTVIATSELDQSTKSDELGKCDTLLRLYTAEHTPQEYAVVCLRSRGRLLAVLCIIIAGLLDLAGGAAWHIARNTAE